jgi:hypothetical protein
MATPPPDISSLVTKLQNKRNIYLAIMTVGVIAIVLAVALMLYKAMPHFASPVVLTSISLIISLGWAHLINLLFIHSSTPLLQKNLSKIIDLSYYKDGSFRIQDLASHNILPTLEYPETTQGFDGTINETQSAFQHASWEKSDLASSIRPYDFDGIIMKLAVKHRFEGHTIIASAQMFASFYETEFSSYSALNPPLKFESKYVIRSSDSVESQVIVDNETLEAIFKISTKLKAQWLLMSFRNDEIYIMLQRPAPLMRLNSIWLPVKSDVIADAAIIQNQLRKLVQIMRQNQQISI